MNFLKKLDHLKLLQFALGISIFSVGYLITMFYFQMKELKEFKQRIVQYNNASLNILHFETDIERDFFYVKNQINTVSNTVTNSQINNQYITNFSKKNKFLNSLETLKLYNDKTKNLFKEYISIRNELVISNSVIQLINLETVQNDLIKDLENQSIYLQNKIEEYNQNYDKMIDNSKTSGFLIALISLVIFVLAYVKMNEDLYKLQKINDEIVFMNQTLSNAEKVAGFGSWKVNTVENRYIFSDNFYRLIGEEPKSFSPSLDGIVNFIHPDDRERVKNSHLESFKNKDKKPTNIVYRYLLKDGTIKYILTVGKFLHNSKGELVKIGVNQDITELMIKSKELEDKNLKLIAINSELESFNNIVGHDLQEPLRKIQMFISRIESKQFLETSSETTIGYFERIKSAAQRMQNLMTDLVDYTRTIKGDRIFEQVDLNEIFEEITEELSLIIEEKNAKITIDQLPTILGTRFQIQQLFINLVSNALKYVKQGISPVIDIRLENFDNELVNEKVISGKDFHKITVSDNGIGFEQKHADKIFMLFKRLETDDSYKGTGLGLAICKKIVDNNNGVITAVGVPEQGSVFTVYLPNHMNLN